MSRKSKSNVVGLKGRGRKPKKAAAPGGGGQTTDRMATVIAGAIVIAILAGIGIVVLSFGKGAYQYAFDPDRFIVQQVDVNGLAVLEKSEVIAFARIAYGAPVLDVDLVAMRDRIEEHARVKKAVVERFLPNRLVITLEERKPIGLVQVDGVMQGIDREGVVIPLMRAKEEVVAPIITGELASASSETLLEALGAIELMRPDLVEKISEIRLDAERGFTLVTTGDPMIIRLGRGDMERKITQLREATEYFEVTDQKKEYIDLRFDEIITRP